MVERIEGPLDYRVLWGMLRHEIQSMAMEMAKRAITERELDRIPGYQGAWRFSHDILSKMDELLSAAQRGNSTVTEEESDGEFH